MSGCPLLSVGLDLHGSPGTWGDPCLLSVRSLGACLAFCVSARWCEWGVWGGCAVRCRALGSAWPCQRCPLAAKPPSYNPAPCATKFWLCSLLTPSSAPQILSVTSQPQTAVTGERIKAFSFLASWPATSPLEEKAVTFPSSATLSEGLSICLPTHTHPTPQPL